MSFDKKLLSFFKKKYGNKITSKSYLFLDIDLDSFELVSLITEIENKFKKKYSPGNNIDFTKVNIKKFQNYLNNFNAIFFFFSQNFLICRFRNCFKTNFAARIN